MTDCPPTNFSEAQFDYSKKFLFAAIVYFTFEIVNLHLCKRIRHLSPLDILRALIFTILTACTLKFPITPHLLLKWAGMRLNLLSVAGTILVFLCSP
jgi:hypothetical protein